MLTQSVYSESQVGRMSYSTKSNIERSQVQLQPQLSRKADENQHLTALSGSISTLISISLGTYCTVPGSSLSKAIRIYVCRYVCIYSIQHGHRHTSTYTTTSMSILYTYVSIYIYIAFHVYSRWCLALPCTGGCST